MSKQRSFFVTEEDKVVIANLLNSVFGELIVVPYYSKDNILSFNAQIEDRVLYLVEKKREHEIVYSIYEDYDGSTFEALDCYASPVLEYSLASQTNEGVFLEGRFYCCSENAEFSKKVSAFFRKLKKTFWYKKGWGLFISKNIDLNNASFLISNRVVKISEDELV